MFLLAGPLHAHGNTGQRARDQGRVRRGVVGAVMAITSGSLDMDQADARQRHPQHLRDALAIGIDTLGVGPDRHGIIDRLRDGAGRADPNRATDRAAYK